MTNNEKKKIYICYDYKTKNNFFYFEQKSIFPEALYEQNNLYENIISKEELKEIIEKSKMPVMTKIVNNITIEIIPIYDKGMCETLKHTKSIESNNNNLVDNDLFSLINYGINAKYNIKEKTSKRK